MGRQESSSTMAKTRVGQMARCFTKEEIHAGVGYVQGLSCGFDEKTAEKKENHAGRHTRRVYVTTAAVGSMPEQAI